MYLLSVLCLVVTFTSDAFVLPPPGSASSKYLADAKHHIAPRQDAPGRPNNDTLNQERADAVRDAFTFAFDGYWEACRGQDELLPVNNGCANPR